MIGIWPGSSIWTWSLLSILIEPVSYLDTFLFCQNFQETFIYKPSYVLIVIEGSNLLKGKIQFSWIVSLLLKDDTLPRLLPKFNTYLDFQTLIITIRISDLQHPNQF